MFHDSEIRSPWLRPSNDHVNKHRILSLTSIYGTYIQLIIKQETRLHLLFGSCRPMEIATVLRSVFGWNVIESLRYSYWPNGLGPLRRSTQLSSTLVWPGLDEPKPGLEVNRWFLWDADSMCPTQSDEQIGTVERHQALWAQFVVYLDSLHTFIRAVYHAFSFFSLQTGTSNPRLSERKTDNTGIVIILASLWKSMPNFRHMFAWLNSFSVTAEVYNLVKSSSW